MGTHIISFLKALEQAIFGASASEATILAGFILTFLGATINFLIEISKRNPHSTRTPQQFSIIFLIKDNQYRFLLSICFCFVAVICGPELLNIMALNLNINPKYTQLIMIMLGWGSDWLPMRIKDKFFKDKTDGPNAKDISAP